MRKLHGLKTTLLGGLLFFLSGCVDAEWHLIPEDWHLNKDITKEMTKSQVVTQRARELVSEDVHYICAGLPLSEKSSN